MTIKPTASGLAFLAAALLSMITQSPALPLIVPSLQIALTSSNTVSLSWQGFLPGVVQECSDLASDEWVTVTNVPTKSNEGDYELILPIQPTGRAYRLGFDCLAQFETLDSSLAARVDCVADMLQLFRWNWSDGTSATNWPVAAKNFGVPDVRLQSLSVSPAAAVTAINLGFDAADDGWTNQIADWPPQNFSAVRFAYPLTNLQFWASSYTPLATLNFSGFTALQCIDCFQCPNLARVVVTNLPALRRVCFESCSLTELDLFGTANLEELRAAGNRYTKVGVGGGVGPKIWHWCTRDNPLTQQFSDVMTNFYSLQDLYVWNNNQSGSLTPVSTNLMDVNAYSNSYTHADFSGHDKLWRCLIFRNNLTNLVLNGCTGLQVLDASRNQLPAAVLDLLLRQLDTNAPVMDYVDLSGNSERPTAVGYEHYSSLTNRGVTVYVDWP
jgi:hypothetical protein